MAQITKQSPVVHSTWLVATRDEQPVYVTGNTPELGEWNPQKALQMRRYGHGKNVHHWGIHLTIPCGQQIEFKFVEKTQEGAVVWEAGENRVFRAGVGDSAIEWGGFRYA